MDFTLNNIIIIWSIYYKTPTTNQPEIKKQRTVLFGIHARISITNIKQCLGVNLKIVQRIQKLFGLVQCDFEGTAAWKPDCSDMKRTHKFVDEIQDIVDIDPGKSFMFKFLIRQVVYEDIWYFLYKMRMGKFLS